MDRIKQLFDNMDRWRHLPSYQLERRADAFFSMYIPEVLAEKYGVEIEGLIPEFPVRIGTIYPNVNTNQSFKIDYLAKAKAGNRLFLIELKTDSSSRRSKQDWYLERSKEVGMVKLLEGLKQIYQASNAKKKYRCLLLQLESLGLIKLSASNKIEVVESEYATDILYIQPDNKEQVKNVISFDEIAEIVGKHTDEVSTRFAQSLLEWAKVKAGECSDFLN